MRWKPFDRTLLGIYLLGLVTGVVPWGEPDHAYYDSDDMQGVNFYASTQKVTAGDTAVLHCSFDAMPRQYMLLYGYDSLVLEWVKVEPDGRGKVIAVGNRLRTLDARMQVLKVANHRALSILIIRDVRKEDAGKYRCHLSLATMRHKYFHLEVVEPTLTLSHNDTKANLKEGDKLVLYCNTNGYPPPMVYWTRRIKHGSNLWSTGDYYIWGNSISIDFLQQSESGTYSCHIDNFVSKRVKIDFDITVSVAPQYLQVYQNGINVGQLKDGPWWPLPEYNRAFTLMCQTQCKSPTDILWYKDDSQLMGAPGDRVKLKMQKSRHRHIKSELIFHRFKRRDLGNYTCRAQNLAGHLQYTFEVDKLKEWPPPTTLWQDRHRTPWKYPRLHKDDTDDEDINHGGEASGDGAGQGSGDKQEEPGQEQQIIKITAPPGLMSRNDPITSPPPDPFQSNIHFQQVDQDKLTKENKAKDNADTAENYIRPAADAAWSGDGSTETMDDPDDEDLHVGSGHHGNFDKYGKQHDEHQPSGNHGEMYI